MYNNDYRCDWEKANPGKINETFNQRDPMKNYDDYKDKPEDCFEDDGRIKDDCRDKPEDRVKPKPEKPEKPDKPDKPKPEDKPNDKLISTLRFLQEHGDRGDRGDRDGKGGKGGQGGRINCDMTEEE